MLATTLATLALTPQLIQPVGGLDKAGVRHDSFTEAFHDSAVCNCAEPLEDFTRYGPINAFESDPASGEQLHNTLFVDLLRFIHAKWEPTLPLEGYETVAIDLERLEQWNLYVETVRADHGLRAGSVPVWPQQMQRDSGGPLVPPSPTSDRITLPQCRECADDMCDGRRILTFAQEAIYGDPYSADLLDEYRHHFFTQVSRLTAESFWLDIPVGHPRPAPACNIGCEDTAHVLVQMIAGDGITLDLPFFDTEQPTMVFVTAYRLCLLRADGSWLCEQYPLMTPRLNHLVVEYGQCHPDPVVTNPPPSSGGNQPGSNGPCGHGFRPIR